MLADDDDDDDNDYYDDGNDVDDHNYNDQLDEPGSPAAPDGLGHSLDLRTPHHDPNLRVNIIDLVIMMTMVIIIAIIIIS